MALKNKYQREKQQYSNDGGLTWLDVSPANYRRGRLIEAGSEDCNTVEWKEVTGSWFCITDKYTTRWITDTDNTECVGYNKYSVEKEQSTIDGGLNWTDTGETRIGVLIESNSVDCGYNLRYRWVNVSNEYVCDGTTKYNKEKEQVSNDDGETWTDTGNTRRGNIVIERYSLDCNYVPLYRWTTVSDDFICNGNNKYALEKEQISMDNGATYEDVIPLNTRQGALVEAESEYCMIYQQYLTTEMLADGVLSIQDNGYMSLTNIAYSKNDGEWTSIGYNGIVSASKGDIIKWKANGKESNGTYSTNYDKTYYTYFYSSANYKVYGNPKSLLYNDDFLTVDETSKEVSFLGLFRNSTSLVDAKRLEMPSNLTTNNALEYMFQGCTSLVNAPYLPATTLQIRSYGYMFKGCTSLVNAPYLPATDTNLDSYEYMFQDCTSLVNAPQMNVRIIDNGACANMFQGCTSLVNAPQLNNVEYVGYEGCANMFQGCISLMGAPELPATTLASGCYSNMFKDCTSLVNVPPIGTTETTLADSCCYQMFNGCTSLTSAPELPATTLASGCYSNMFKDCTSLTTAPVLPARTLELSCYVEMFSGCTSLTTAPALPATTLASGCYSNMFKDCTSLTTAPVLPARTLELSCYVEMFSGCTSLTTAPALPATTLASGCYSNMFKDCTSLVSAPSVLPATTLVSSCYYRMFSGCRSLTTAPELPAETLVVSCYGGMFQGCRSLNYIKALFITKPSTTYTNNWVNSVASTGTFVKNSAAEWKNVTGVNGVPSGWTVVTE